jgi:hypothetical protein
VLWIKGGGRLVAEKERCLLGYDPGEEDALVFAAAQLGSSPIQPSVHAEATCRIKSQTLISLGKTTKVTVRTAPAHHNIEDGGVTGCLVTLW